VSQQKGFETAFGGLEIAQGILAGTTEVTNGFILDRRDIDRGEIARAHQAGQLHGVTTVGFDAIASLFGNQGWGDDPADMPPFREITIEPIAAGASLVDEDKMLAFRLKLADERVEVTLVGTDGAKIDDLGMVFFSHVGDRDRLFMDIQSNIERARLWHG
jgi:hypothetical protein